MTLTETHDAITAAATRMATIDARLGEIATEAAALQAQLGPLYSEQGSLNAERAQKDAALADLKSQLYIRFANAMVANPDATTFAAIGGVMDAEG